MLNGVPSYAIDDVWEGVRPFILHCLLKSKEHRYNGDDIELMLREGAAQLWVQGWPKVDGVVITQLQTYPRAKECVVFMACGKLRDDWEQTLASLVDGAKKLGCTHASAYTRPGFVKMLTGNWHPRQTYIVKELT